MSNITEIYYEELDPSVADLFESAEFYFYHNLMGIDDRFDQGYIDHERNQIYIRNKVIKDALNAGRMQRHPNVSSAILGLSSLRDKMIIAVDYMGKEVNIDE